MPTQYLDFKYLYPPRPAETTHPSELSKYEGKGFIAQPKYNGTCCVVFMNENELHVMNRHKSAISSNYNHIDFRGMYKGKGWMVICGEFLNKNKRGENGEPFNLKFVIWDILVYDGVYLTGSTFENRQKLLSDLFPCLRMRVGSGLETFDYLCFTNYAHIYRAPLFDSNFTKLFNEIVKTDLYEGIVLKRRDAKLLYGLSERNNNDWQIKCRKPTKLYKF